MKTKKEQFVQHLSHDIYDEEEADLYLDKCLPLIGYITMWFNGLEQSLDSVICQIFTDRTDSTGLIVLHKMTYSAKVDLFKRFSDDFHSCFEESIVGYDELMKNLKESGRLRNMVVHADWENTNEDGYTYVNLRISKGGMEQEYAQFSEGSLEKIIDLIIKTRTDLYSYWENRNDKLYNRE
ncbi:hypothetical protein [uncultured Tenacibaculum sp.]|uniref:hypothetical protein n=1 Tax=uncultured Tenacibaculum sp. TaxID=174713 RepID=UPI0026236F5D|nr:hypothetical protein [uncultured Tenacibaculum sp.]